MDSSLSGLCMKEMEVKSNTCSVGQPVKTSTYVCTHPKPCPEHPEEPKNAL